MHEFVCFFRVSERGRLQGERLVLALFAVWFDLCDIVNLRFVRIAPEKNRPFDQRAACQH